MSRTYSELAQEVERLGATNLGRSGLRVAISPGGMVAGRIRLSIRVVREDGGDLLPMRCRRYLGLIKARLEGHLMCVIQPSEMAFSLLVEDLT